MEPTESTPAPAPSKKESFWELVKFVVLTLAIVIPIRTYVAQPFIVSGESMVPTFQNGQYLIIDELSYNFRSPARGEVIVFRYPKDPSKYFIKRVVGLPGETVTVSGNTISIEGVDGESVVLDEPYVQNEGYNNLSTTMAEGEYFVMGDNRPVSLDSRSWGAVSEDMIKGRALVRLLPITKIDLLPGALSDFNNK